MINVLIVDDEKYARSRVRNLLTKVNKPIEIFEAENTAVAHEITVTSNIDLLFLDIQMPNQSGIEFLKSLVNAPYVVFITAHLEYALESYNLNAVDYLLKPFTEERFQRALEKAELFIENSRKNTILLRDSNTTYYIQPNNILYVKSEGNYIHIFTDSDNLFVRGSLSHFYKKLDEAYFSQINRSTVINLHRVRECRSVDHGDMVILLTNGKSLKLSRNYKKDFLLKSAL